MGRASSHGLDEAHFLSFGNQPTTCAARRSRPAPPPPNGLQPSVPAPPQPAHRRLRVARRRRGGRGAEPPQAAPRRHLLPRHAQRHRPQPRLPPRHRRHCHGPHLTRPRHRVTLPASAFFWIQPPRLLMLINAQVWIQSWDWVALHDGGASFGSCWRR